MLRFLLLLITVLVCPTQFSASEENDNPPTLPEIVVEDSADSDNSQEASGATKIPSPVREIPQSVEVVNRQTREEQGAKRLQEVSDYVLGATPADGGTLPFLLRGFRADVLRNGFTSSKTLFFNVYDEELANVERVEFVRGAVSALYGNAGAGGAINVVTKKPLDYRFFSAEATGGNFDFYRSSLDVSLPINDDKTLLARFNGAYQNSGRFRDFLDSERILLAPALNWKISPSLSLAVGGEYFRADEPFDSGIVAVGNDVADIPLSRRFQEQTDRGLHARSILEIELKSALGGGVSLRNALRFNRTMTDSLTNSPALLLPDNRSLLRFIVDLDFKSDLYDTQNEIIARFETGALRHVVLVGAEFNRENVRERFRTSPLDAPPNLIDIFDPQYGNVTEIPLVSFFDFRIKSSRLGIYAQDEIALLDKLRLIAGVRYDYFNMEIDNVGNTLSPNFSADKDDSRFIPRVGIIYDLAKWVSIYASYSQSLTLLFSSGFRADTSALDPETSRQYEGGVRLNLWDGRLASTFSLFKIDAKGSPAPDPVNGPVFSVQVDEARSQGVEASCRANPVLGWTIAASYAFTDAEVVEDEFFEAGGELAGVARHRANLWTTYGFHGGVLDGFGVGFGMIASSARAGDIQNTFDAESYLRLDAALYYKKKLARIGDLTASVNFKNITDEDYIENSSARTIVIPGAPFTVLGSLRLGFGSVDGGRQIRGNLTPPAN